MSHWRREDISVITAFKFFQDKIQDSCESQERSGWVLVKNTEIKVRKPRKRYNFQDKRESERNRGSPVLRLLKSRAKRVKLSKQGKTVPTQHADDGVLIVDGG